MIENVENKDLLSFEIEKNIVDDKKVIGSFEKNSATIELLNPDNKYSNLKGTYISTTRGTFYVDKIDPIQENIKIKLHCYDLAHKFDNKYDSSKFIFPMSLKVWKQAICEELGIITDLNYFPNCNKIIEEQPYIKDNATYRDIIKMIAKAGTCWAIIDYDDVLKFQWFDNTINNNIEDWFELKTEDNEIGPFNVVVLGRGDVEDNVVYPKILPINPKEIRIDSNDILDSDRNNMIIPIYNHVNGFKYKVFSMRTSGRLGAKVGQKITYLDMFKKIHSSFIMKHVLTLSGGDYTKEYNWVSFFEAIELDETNTNYEYSESPEEKINRTERLANKLNGIISDVVEEVAQHAEKITKVEQTSEKIEQSVSEIVDAKRNIKGKTLELKDCAEGQLYSLKITGDIIPIFPRNNLYPSETLFLKPKPKLIITHTEGDKQLITTYDLPFTYLAKYNSEIYDEFIVDNETNAKLIRRVGLDANGEKFPLEEESIIDLGKLEVLLFGGTNKVEINYYNVNFEAEYVVKNDITDFYAVNTQVSSKFKQLRNEIELLVEQETDGEKLIASINITPGQIKLEGTVTANGNFQILKDGSIVAKNGSFSGNIYLENGGRVIGGDGLFSNLQFSSIGILNGWTPIGFTKVSYDENTALYQDIVLDYFIPENFTIENACLELYTSCIKTSYLASNYDMIETVGKPKSLKLYKGDNSSTYEFFWSANTEYWVDGDPYMSEIPKAFSNDSYTPKNSGIGAVDKISSIDLKNSIEKGRGQLIVRTSISKNNISRKDLAENTGIGRAILYVFGYMSKEEENSNEEN